MPSRLHCTLLHLTSSSSVRLLQIEFKKTVISFLSLFISFFFFLFTHSPSLKKSIFIFLSAQASWPSCFLDPEILGGGGFGVNFFNSHIYLQTKSTKPKDMICFPPRLFLFLPIQPQLLSPSPHWNS